MKRPIETFEVSYTVKDLAGSSKTSFEYFRNVKRAFKFMEKHPGSAIKMVWK